MFRKFLHGNLKYFSLSALFVILTLLLEVFTPYIVNRTENNWDTILTDEIEEIKFFIIRQVRDREEKIEEAEKGLTDRIKKVDIYIDSSGIAFQILSDEKYDDFNLEIFSSNFELIGWNNDKIFSEDDIKGSSFAPGEDFFHTYKLKTYLSRIDTFITKGQIYLVAVSLPFEKHFAIQDKYFEEKNFLKNLEEKFRTPFRINYSSESSYSLDGRDHSFEILNNYNNKIGLVTFEKPLKVNAVLEAEDFKFKLQAILIILAYIFLGAGFFKYFYTIKSQFLKFIILMIYFGGFRIIFFL